MIISGQNYNIYLETPNIIYYNSNKKPFMYQMVTYS